LELLEPTVQLHADEGFSGRFYHDVAPSINGMNGFTF
jgi:hypothetical protein